MDKQGGPQRQMVAGKDGANKDGDSGGLLYHQLRKLISIVVSLKST